MLARFGLVCGRLARVLLALGLVSVAGDLRSWAQLRGGACQREVVEGEVRAGEAFVRPVGNGLEVMLEPLASGWIVRVLPVAGPRQAHDYAELATPPYASVSPLLMSTDFSFRAQDVVAWNPRRFRFAASARDFERLLGVYGRYRATVPAGGAVEAELAELVSHMPEGVVQIVDAKLTPGMANQSQMAAMVASHFSTTAHTVEEPAEGKGSALGRVEWMRFRVSLDVPAGFKLASGAKVERRPCR